MTPDLILFILMFGGCPYFNILGTQWFINFIYDCIRVTCLLLMKDKSEVPQLFIQFYHRIKTQFGKCIKTLQSNNGREYVNQCVSSLFSQNGIIPRKLTCVDTSHQNGVGE